MIVLKAVQDKILCALQSVAGIVDRRHTAPFHAGGTFTDDCSQRAGIDGGIRTKQNGAGSG